MTFEFKKHYFFWFLLFLAIETAIATFLKTGFIRHTFGDFLIVILLYCLIKSFWNAKSLNVGILVLVIAYGIEFLQLTNFLKALNLSDNRAAQLIFGNTFEVSDLVAYTLGIITGLLIEYQFQTFKPKKSSIV